MMEQIEMDQITNFQSYSSSKSVLKQVEYVAPKKNNV